MEHTLQRWDQQHTCGEEHLLQPSQQTLLGAAAAAAAAVAQPGKDTAGGITHAAQLGSQTEAATQSLEPPLCLVQAVGTQGSQTGGCCRRRAAVDKLAGRGCGAKLVQVTSKGLLRLRQAGSKQGMR